LALHPSKVSPPGPANEEDIRGSPRCHRHRRQQPVTRCIPHRDDTGRQLSGCWQITPLQHAFRLPFWSGTQLASSKDTNFDLIVSIPRAARAVAKCTVKLLVWFCAGFVCEDLGKTGEIASCRRLGGRGRMLKLRPIDANFPNHLRSKTRRPSFVTRNPFESSRINRNPRANLEEILRRIQLQKFAPMSCRDTKRLFRLVIRCRSS
jgi:hypothetical protein